jgi:hypothetical protein
MSGKDENFNEMSEIEFLVLDELYLLISFEELLYSVDRTENELVETLNKLYMKKWIMCYDSLGEQLDDEKIDLNLTYGNYHYLATKAGLKAHNSM